MELTAQPHYFRLIFTMYMKVESVGFLSFTTKDITKPWEGAQLRPKGHSTEQKQRENKEREGWFSLGAGSSEIRTHGWLDDWTGCESPDIFLGDILLQPQFQMPFQLFQP